MKKKQISKKQWILRIHFCLKHLTPYSLGSRAPWGAPPEQICLRTAPPSSTCRLLRQLFASVHGSRSESFGACRIIVTGRPSQPKPDAQAPSTKLTFIGATSAKKDGLAKANRFSLLSATGVQSLHSHWTGIHHLKTIRRSPDRDGVGPSHPPSDLLAG